jgi:hypothetical protein
VIFKSGKGTITLLPAKRPTLSDLLAKFDPTRHRRRADERPRDDDPKGCESI